MSEIPGSPRTGRPSGAGSKTPHEQCVAHPCMKSAALPASSRCSCLPTFRLSTSRLLRPTSPVAMLCGSNGAPSSAMRFAAQLPNCVRRESARRRTTWPLFSAMVRLGIGIESAKRSIKRWWNSIIPHWNHNLAARQSYGLSHKEYIANGARLGWLFDPFDNGVTIYRPGQLPERIENPTVVHGDPVLPGFQFDFREIL